MKLFILSLCLTVVLALSVKQEIQPRIVGGEDARSGQYKFAAAIYVHRANGIFFCGGALLSHQWILTAAQCADGATLFDIRLGSNILEGDDPYAVRVSADTYVLHPDYDSATLDNDIGLIWLRLPVQYSDYLSAVDYLPFEELKQDSSGAAIGWGQLGDEVPGLVNDLQYVYVVALSNTECQQTYGNQITASMVCVAGNQNQGICIGDAGSPLVQVISRGHTVVVGVASFISQNGCESDDPSGFARVFEYNEWITNVTGRT